MKYLICQKNNWRLIYNDNPNTFFKENQYIIEKMINLNRNIWKSIYGFYDKGNARNYLKRLDKDVRIKNKKNTQINNGTFNSNF
jgi:hypothetical protein